jgi:hypothetical protein
MSAKTTADLFRERGWGVGTLVQRSSDTPFRVTFLGREHVLMERCDNGTEVAVCRLDDWSLYTPTPPIPTREEWAELWPKLKAFRKACVHHHRAYQDEMADVLESIDAIAAKVQP